jgi:hypothetical protein
MEIDKMTNPMNLKRFMTAIAALMLITGFCQHEMFAKQKNEQNAGGGKTEDYYYEKNKPRGELYKQAQKENKENAGHVILNFLPDRSVVAPNLRQLSRFSTDIIIGRVLENRSYLNDEGDEIHKYLTVLAQQVFKGTIVNAGRITIRCLGGTWLYSDGFAVTWIPIGETVPTDGKSFVFFLSEGEDSEDETAGYFIPTLGTQGVFEIDFDMDVIVPTDLNKRDPVVRKYLNVPMTEFFDEINSVVGEEVSDF